MRHKGGCSDAGRARDWPNRWRLMVAATNAQNQCSAAFAAGIPGGSGNFTTAPSVRVYRPKNALARAPISAATAPLPPQTGLNGSHAGADSIKPIWGGRGAAGKKLFWQPLCCPTLFCGIRAAVAPQNLRDARRGSWEGPSQISAPLVAFSPKTASRRETRTPNRPTSCGPLVSQIVSDRRRPYGR